MARGYNNLKVWNKSVDLADYVYNLADKFPKDELYGLMSQVKRSAVSVPSNIAEGHERHGTREFVQFIGIARGSLAELETQILISKRRNFISEEDYINFKNMAEEISRMLWSLRQNLQNKLK